MAEIDFEAEGLLEGTEGEQREARLALLRELADDGATLEELRRAVAENRLALLPAERVLGGEGVYTLAEVAERSGLPEERFRRELQALGVSVPPPDERAFDEADVEMARRVRTAREAGLPDTGMLEVARVLGMTMSQLAAANRTLVAEAFADPDSSERDIGLRYARAARELAPLLGPALEYVLNLHTREQLRQQVITGAEPAAGTAAGSTQVTVCFADLVGFTRLGERLEADQIGALGGRLGELATEAVRPPVRLVKLIGDAAMLVAPESGPVLDAALTMIERADADEEFPPIRAGISAGPALSRGGDWYGRPVNLASRITAVARPSSVLVGAEVREAAGDEFRFSRAGSRSFKGIKGTVELYRARRASDPRWRRPK